MKSPAPFLFTDPRKKLARTRDLLEKSEKRRRQNVHIEALEPRVLLDATPLELITLTASDLSVRVDDSGAPTIQILDNQTHSILASRALADTSQVVITGSDSDDSLTIDASAAALDIVFAGGQGENSIHGAKVDSTWNITGDGAGSVGHLTFTDIDNLIGATDNNDTFIFSADGRVSGFIDGGAGGFDTLIVNGSGANATYNFATRDSGSVERAPGDVIHYRGLEPITISPDPIPSNPVDVILNYDTAGTLTISGSGNDITVSGTGAETITFQRPTGTLTINASDGDDTIVLNSLGNFTGSLTINAGDGQDHITVNAITGSGSYTINGELDDDTITINPVGSTKSIHVDGGTGNDTYELNRPGSGSLGTIILTDASGNDTLDLTNFDGTLVSLSKTGATGLAASLNLNYTAGTIEEITRGTSTEIELAAGQVNAFLDGLEALVAWAKSLQGYAELGKALPLIGGNVQVGVGEALQIADALDQLRIKVKNAIHDASTVTTDTILNAITGFAKNNIDHLDRAILGDLQNAAVVAADNFSFQVNINGAGPVTVSATGATSLSDLVDRLNAAIGLLSSLQGKVKAVLNDGRIAIQAIDNGEDFDSIAVNAVNSIGNEAVSKLGFKTTAQSVLAGALEHLGKLNVSVAPGVTLAIDLGMGGVPELVLHADYSGTRTTNFSVDLGSEIGSAGISFNADATLSAMATLSAGLDFRMVLDTVPSFLINLGDIAVHLGISATPNANIAIGFLGAHVNGTAALSANATLSLANGTGISISQLNDFNSSIGGLTPSFTLSSSLNGQFDVSLSTALSGLTVPGTAHFALTSSDLLSGSQDDRDSNIHVTFTDLANLLKFDNISAAGLAGLLGQLSGWIENMTASRFGDLEIPFTNETVADVLKFKDMLSDLLLFDDGDSSVPTPKKLVNDLNDALAAAGVSSQLRAEGNGTKLKLISKDPSLTNFSVSTVSGADWLGFTGGQSTTNGTLTATNNAKTLGTGTPGDAVINITIGSDIFVVTVSQAALLDNVQVGYNIPKLLFSDNSPTFKNAQEFAQRLSDVLSSILGLETPLHYDAVDKTLSFSIDLNHSLFSKDIPLNFNVDLSPIAQFSSSSALHMSANGELHLTIGFDLEDPAPSTLLTVNTTVASLNGGDSINIKTAPSLMPPADAKASNYRLSSDAHLKVFVNGSSTATNVTITKAATKDNTSVAQLLSDINTALSTAGISTITATAVHDAATNTDKIKLTGSGSVASFNVDASSSDAAGRELGFDTHQVSAANIVTAKSALRSSIGRFGSDVTFTATVDGVATVVTIHGEDTEGTTGIDASTNNTIVDLVNDINKALRAAGLQTLTGGNIDASSKLRADFAGNRLLFTAGTGVTGFSINAGATAASELGLKNGTQNADLDDIIINTHDGSVSRVSLDGVTDVGDIIQRIVLGTGGSGTIDKTPTVPEGIEGLIFGKVTVSFNDGRTGLKFSDNTVGGTTFAVMAANGSKAALDLHIVGVDGLDDGQDFDGIVNGGQIASVTLADRFYLQNATASASLSVTTPGGINASAVFGGFVGISLSGNGSISANVSAGLKNPTTGILGGRVTFSQLVHGLATDISSVVQTPIFTGSGSFSLSVSTSPDLSSLITLGASPHVDITLADISNPSSITVNPSGLGDLLKFNSPEFNFSTILNALTQLSGFLSQFQQFGFLNEQLPLIDMSISDVLDFATKLNNAINQASANPAGSIQSLEAKLKQALGLPAASTAISLTLDTSGSKNVLKVGIHLDSGFSKMASVAIPEIDLGLPAPFDSLLDFGGSADLAVTGNLGLDLVMGVDLAHPSDVYVYNTTGVGGTLAATGNNLEFMAALGPLGLFIKDGMASISGSIKAGLDLDNDGDVDDGTEPTKRILLTDLLGALGDNLEVDVNGGIDVNLPTYFPVESHSIGAFGLHIASADFTNPSFNLSDALTLPTFSLDDFTHLGIFDSIQLAVDGLDTFLEGLQDVVDGKVLNMKIPFVGDKLSAAGGFIQDFREGFIDKLRSFIEAADDFQRDFTDPNENFLSKLMFDLLGDPAHTGKAFSLNLLKPLSGHTATDLAGDYIDLSTDGETFVQWNFSMGGHYAVGKSINMDIGMPGLGLEADGSIGIQFDWDLDLGFGLSTSEGFYLDVSDANELFANVVLTLPNSFTGHLAFLQLTAENADVYAQHSGESNVAIAFAVDIVNKKDGSDEHLGMAEFSKIGFNAGIAAEAVAELNLSLEVDKGALNLTDAAAGGFPKVQSAFVLDWGVGSYHVGNAEASTFVPVQNIGNALKDGLHYVGFKDVSMDAGSFLSDVIGPIVAKVKEITEPLQPIIDVITAPIPVLSDLGPPISLLDIAAAFGSVDPGMIQSIADIISLINRIPDPASAGSLMLNFGSFDIFDNRPGTPSPILSDLTNPGLNTGNLFNNLKGNLSPVNFDTLLGGSSTGGNASKAKTKSTMQSLRGGDAGGGFTFPVFDDPSQIFGMLMGQPATLIAYDMAPLHFEFNWSQFFSIFGPLGVSINIGFSADIDFAFGYDTLGIKEFVDSGFKNAAALLDGFFISDTKDGIDVPEVVLKGNLWAAAELNLGVARAGVAGGIFAEIELNLFDDNHDGKVRISELAMNFLNQLKAPNTAERFLAPLAIFDVHGEITAKLFAFLKIDLFFFQVDETFDITPPIVLLSFDIDFFRPPVLATELSNGDLILNMGRFAKDRMLGDITDGNEHFEVQSTGAGHVQVRAFGLGSDAEVWQDYAVSGKIIAYGDEGNDNIDLDLVTGGVGYLIEGGAGNDTITLNAAATGAALIKGDDGDDTITSGGGADTIYGGRGVDIIHGGAGIDIIFGDNGEITVTATALVKFDDGNDTIYGDDGNDIILGGGGVDHIEGGANNDLIIGDGGSVILASKVVSETNRGIFADDVIFGNSGNDTIYAGRGNDIVDGSAGNDTIFGEDGDDKLYGGGGGDTIMAGDGDDVIWGLRDSGAAIKDTTDATSDGDDTIFASAGDDIIHGNGGDDKIHGESGDDKIYGEDGADQIFGEGGDDLIYGGHDADIIDGGAGDDVIFGDAGAADFTGAFTSQSTNPDVYGTNIPTTLAEHYTFGTTKSSGSASDTDTIYVYSGADFVDGQQGADIYVVRLQGADHASFINVYDSGNSVADTDYLQIFGTPYDDQFLLRASSSLTGLAFVAMLNTGTSVERVNYWNNERLQVNGSFGDDYFAIDDIRAETTITGDEGNDQFQVGQLYRSPRDAGSSAFNNVEVEDVYATIETTIGFLSNGISRPTTIYGGVGNDIFTVFHNKAVLSLFGDDGDDNFLIKAFALAGSQEPFRDRTDISGGAGADLVQYAVNAPVNIDGGDGLDTVTVIGTEFGDDFVITKSGVYGAGLNVNFVNIESLVVDGAEGDDRFFVQSTSEKFITQLFGGLGSDTFNMSGDVPPVISNDLKGHSGVITQQIENLASNNYDNTVIAGVAVNVYDNDPDPVVVITETDGVTEVTEGGPADSYTLRLSKAPTADVFVQVYAPLQTPDDVDKKSKLFRVSSATQVAGTSDGTSITLKFTAGNWFTPQTVNISAQDDASPGFDFNDDALEGMKSGFANHVVTSSVGITGSPSTVTTNTLADGTKETVITVAGTPFAGKDLGGYLFLITDGPAAGQSLRVKKVNSGSSLTLWGAFRSDSMPNGTSIFQMTKDIEAVRAIPVTVYDNDTAAVIIAQTDNSTDLFENGSTDQISVRLGRQPDFNVTVNLLSNDGQLSFSQNSITFTNGNWDTPVLVTVTAVNDALVEGLHHALISYTTSSADVNTDVGATETKTLAVPQAYVGLEHSPKNAQVIQVKVENESTHVLEVRAANRYTVQGNKVIFLKSNGDYELLTGQVQVTYNWVRAGYNGLTVTPTLTNIADNEAPQVVVTETGGSTDVIEGTGSPDTYSVRLTQAPTGDVYIRVTPEITKTSAGKNIHFGQQVTVSSVAPGSTNNADGTVTLKFTAGNWETPQIVSVAAVDDAIYDGDDTQYFAPQPHSVTDIQGPVYVAGQGGTGSIVPSDPLMLPYEINKMIPTDNVQSVSPDHLTMTVNKATLLTKAGDLDPKVLTVADLVTEGMTITIADGALDLIGQFKLITAAVDNGTTVTLTFNEAFGPGAITKYTISHQSQNFFAVEAEQIDYMFVNNEDSPAENTGARAGVLQDSTTVGFAGNSIVESFVTKQDGKWLSGLGMGPENLNIGGVLHPRGITYGDLEVVEINMGAGKDDFSIQDTTTRSDGYQTWTIINTGRGDDNITTNLKTDVQVLAAGTVSTANPTTFNTATNLATVAGGDVHGLLVRIVGGTGQGQQRLITQNTAGSVTVDKAWDTALDSTSKFEIVGAVLKTGTSTATTLPTANTLTDSGASFGGTNSLVGKLIEITSGSGTGTVREIIANTGTSVTVSSIWNSVIDGTSKYRIYGDHDGAIAVNLQDGNDIFNGAGSSIGLVVFGGAGNDTITGGTGTDTLFGDNGLVEYKDETGQIVTLLGRARTLLDPQYLDAFTANTLTDNDGNYPVQSIDQEGLVGYRLSIPDGRGFGQRAQITGNTTNTLTVTPIWDGQLLTIPDWATDHGHPYNVSMDFNPIDPQANPTKYRISLVPENQTDGVTRDPVLIIATDPNVGGNDTINGGGGNDTIMGGAGNDIIHGDADDDTIFGDMGRLDYTPAVVGAHGPTRGDFVTATLNRVRTTYDTTGGGDTVFGDGGNDTILGGFNSATNDTLNGGTGNDMILGDNALLTFVPNNDTPANPRDSYLTIVQTIALNDGGNDTINGDDGADILVGGKADDTIDGNDGNDVMIGDSVMLTFAADGTTIDRIETIDRLNGGVDTMYGRAGDDLIIGGTKADNLDGGLDKDLIFGDNVVLQRVAGSGNAIDPRFRALTLTTIYDGNGLPLVVAEAAAATNPVPGGRPAWSDFTITLDQSLDINQYGNDYIAGGGGNDEIFGQLGDDTIQGDGSIDSKISGGAVVGAARGASSPLAMTPTLNVNTPGALTITPSFEAATDGDDYIEGNAGNDTIFGNLGQDDIIGGNSSMFSLNDPAHRADGSDKIFGGAGTDTARNDAGDSLHSRDADMILGDNGNIYRLVGTGGTYGAGYLTFVYDNYDLSLRIIPRASGLLDYTPGGIDFNAAAATDIGAADEIHGESGDDFIYGMKGDDVLFGEGQDDDIIGGYGNDWISGGTGDDGILGDDGRISTSRNGSPEPLYGLAASAQSNISTPGNNTQSATIFVTGQLNKTVELTPFSVDTAWTGIADEFGPGPNPHRSDDIIYGGWGNDFIHGGAGDDAISGAEAMPTFYARPANPGDVLGYDPATGKFREYDATNPATKIATFFLNFDETEGPAVPGFPAIHNDGNDIIFGDLGNDWVVGGTGQDHLWGGWGDDLLNGDDNLNTAGGANNTTDDNASYNDIAFGGAGRDVLYGNTMGDRLIDWSGEYNSYVVPFSPFGVGAVSRQVQPSLPEYLYALSRADGADRTLGNNAARNGEPAGEIALVLTGDQAWQDQQGGPRDPQPGNGKSISVAPQGTAILAEVSNQIQNILRNDQPWMESGGGFTVDWQGTVPDSAIDFQDRAGFSDFLMAVETGAQKSPEWLIEI